MPQSKTRPKAKAKAGSNSSKYTATTWGRAGAHTFDLEVPSGQLCQVRRVTVEGLMKAGVLRNIDSLSAIVDDRFLKPGGGDGKDEAKDLDMARLLADPAALSKVLETVDRVICHVVIQPEVLPVPEDDEERVDGAIYVDTVDLQDKMFIFQYVLGGTSDLERFRDGSDELVAGLAPFEGLPDEAE